MQCISGRQQGGQFGVAVFYSRANHIYSVWVRCPGMPLVGTARNYLELELGGCAVPPYCFLYLWVTLCLTSESILTISQYVWKYRSTHNMWLDLAIYLKHILGGQTSLKIFANNFFLVWINLKMISCSLVSLPWRFPSCFCVCGWAKCYPALFTSLTVELLNSSYPLAAAFLFH